MYKETDGIWIFHKTYSMANGNTLMNTIADHVQSNDNIGLDDAMTLTMRIFSWNASMAKFQIKSWNQFFQLSDRNVKKFLAIRQRFLMPAVKSVAEYHLVHHSRLGDALKIWLADELPELLEETERTD
ncbi:hypothetical protein B9Z55_007793 [Caenorhabditis nigoni]|uniref:Uncharacterized protein n=1 Tax=Caenorhabditis nigoni TaxID=1611254 RepID=A0A2G5VBF5_9PELO|nr:hypothetical protein B9Z55_007793 [Caenorhabditis nigoni]